ncbi:hypothetical protein KY284_006522 [Solanum tuberosum]|nr:hypothetical protein KY284_006522 [Solanum tuberosum]
MDSSSSSSSSSLVDKSSQKLFALAQQLRLYKPPPPTPFGDDDEAEADFEEQKLEERVGKVVSQLGFQESVTPVSVVQKERFKPKRAAVLICLFEGVDGELQVILTKRSSKLSTHSGEVALPGGKAEEGDASDADTATREAKEEIGLDPSLVNVVTCLEPFLSKHLLRVIPVIGILSNKKEFNPTPNVSEVEAVFDVPLEMFLKDENRKSEEREWMGEKYLIHLFDYEMDNKKYLIWGLTAGILIRAASVVAQMASNRSESLVKLAERLRLYNPISTQSSKIQEFVPKNQELGINPIPKSNRAAVLVCLFEDPQGHLRVILTKRASTLSSHSGEVALPGGKVEEGDADDIETALREAEEEIGLDRSLVDVVTVLESFTNKKGITVIPVVGILWDRNTFNPLINTAEVAALFDAPLEMFLKDENRREQEREYMGDVYVLHFFDHETENEKYIIWAITAGILIKAASIVAQMACYRSERLMKLGERLRLYNPINTQIQEFVPKNQELGINPIPKSNRAAVLVCLFEDSQGHLRVILTKRASTLSSHSGEVALPGGKVEEGDADDIETALREAEEEIGLDRSLVDVVTVLESFTAKKGITVIPVVGILWDRNAFNPLINTAEVASIFDAPLEMFLKDENRREQEFEHMGDKYVIHFFDHQTENEKYIIWAFTAAILIKAASVVYKRPPDFQDRRPTFWNRSRQ